MLGKPVIADKRKGVILKAMKLKMMFVSLLSTFSLSAGPLKVGAKLPELKGKNQDGKEVAIKAADGHQWLVIFTYPKALTGG